MPPIMDTNSRIIQCRSVPKPKRELMSLRLDSNLSLEEEENQTAEEGESVQIHLEFSHNAKLRRTPTAEGFTHDWVITVRGSQNNYIQHFVERIEFHLHKSFANSKRVSRDPPYQVSETGYGGFILPIDIFLRNNTTPKKVRFQYELFLPIGSSCTRSRSEMITFRNPSEMFLCNLIQAGATLCSNNDSQVQVLPLTECRQNDQVQLLATEQMKSPTQKKKVFKKKDLFGKTQTGNKNETVPLPVSVPDRCQPISSSAKEVPSSISDPSDSNINNTLPRKISHTNGNKRRIKDSVEEEMDDSYDPKRSSNARSKSRGGKKRLRVAVEAPVVASTSIASQSDAGNNSSIATLVPELNASLIVQIPKAEMVAADNKLYNKIKRRSLSLVGGMDAAVAPVPLSNVSSNEVGVVTSQVPASKRGRKKKANKRKK